MVANDFHFIKNNRFIFLINFSIFIVYVGIEFILKWVLLLSSITGSSYYYINSLDFFLCSQIYRL
jgi:hypothetical protein